METLSFYDIKSKRKFDSNKYTVKINKRGMRYAEATTPSGGKAFRILGKK